MLYRNFGCCYFEEDILFLCIDISNIIFVSVILKKIKLALLLFICVAASFPTRYSSSSSNISDYVNIIEIAWTQHYTRIA